MHVWPNGPFGRVSSTWIGQRACQVGFSPFSHLRRWRPWSPHTYIALDSATLPTETGLQFDSRLGAERTIARGREQAGSRTMRRGSLGSRDLGGGVRSGPGHRTKPPPCRSTLDRRTTQKPARVRLRTEGAGPPGGRLLLACSGVCRPAARGCPPEDRRPGSRRRPVCPPR